MIRRPRSRQVLASLLMASAICADSVRLTAQRLEYDVKAAFLYNFITLTEWPAEAFDTPDEPFRICVAGADPFDGLLDRTVSGESFGTHPMTVERLAPAAAPNRCHVLFVPRAEMANAARLVRAAPRALAVGETPVFLREGGVVAFVLEAGRVRFDVNLPAAEERRLRISSKLLRLARNTLQESRR